MPDQRASTSPTGDAPIEDYTNHAIFNGSFDSLDSHIRRKKAAADTFRYSLLYILYENDRLTRQQLAAATDRTGNSFEHHVRQLLDANLIARVPAPGDADGRLTEYRITTIGRQEIAADLRTIQGAETAPRTESTDV